VIEVPADHVALRIADPALGRAWREASARAIEACLDAALVGAWIDRAGRYMFVPQEAVLA
jgi:hypothetical protein